VAKVGITITELDSNPMITYNENDTSISYYQTKDSLRNPEDYKYFLKNATHAFRVSPFYKKYKCDLMEKGLNRCVVQSNLTSEHCSIEMHHNILNIFEITFMICEHMLNTVGKINTYELVSLLKEEHSLNNVPIAMITVTGHELNHANDDFFVHPDSTFGNWVELIRKYNKGMTPEIANKLIRYLDNCTRVGKSSDGELLTLRNDIYDWSII
jgi:hypothetical protein